MLDLFTLIERDLMLFCSNLEYSLQAPMPPSFNTLDYSLDNHHHNVFPQNQQQQQQHLMVDYMPQQQPPPPQQISSSGFYGATSFDKLNFADVMQFADFGPKLALNQAKSCEETAIDPVYFLKFPVLNDKMEEQNLMMMNNNTEAGDGEAENEERFNMVSVEDKSRVGVSAEEERMIRGDEETRVSDDNNSVQIRFLGHEELVKNSTVQENKNKRKRPRTVKTSEEVESQRMTHIAVERNRRKQMNEHLRVLRSLMPGSYVQRVCNYIFCTQTKK